MCSCLVGVLAELGALLIPMEESGAILSAPLGLGALVTTLIGAVPWPVLRETGALLASLKRSRAVLVPLRGPGDVQDQEMYRFQ